MLSHSFDHGARTPSSSQFQTKAPSPFGGRVQPKPLSQRVPSSRSLNTTPPPGQNLQGPDQLKTSYRRFPHRQIAYNRYHRSAHTSGRASTKRTKAKPVAVEQEPTSAEPITALEELVQLLKDLFVAAMQGESLTSLITRGLTELWKLVSKT
ncbi:hypothetical protein ACJJTC_009209 [Scirpophaga incertulas]